MNPNDSVIFYNPDHSTWLGHRLENSGVHQIVFYRSASVKFSLPPISFRTRLTRKHDEWEEKSVMTVMMVMPETSELGEKPRQQRDLRLRLRLQQKLPICLPLSWMNKRKSNNNNSSSNKYNSNNCNNNKNNNSPRCSI